MQPAAIQHIVLHVVNNYHQLKIQQGQHPLTGQRATNFRLLANQ